MSLAERRWLRLFTLCALYVAQGMPWGFMATTLPAYLTNRGLDFGFVTATLSFTTLPYAFKWIWGPIIDTFTIPRFGLRRPWILFAQTMMAVTVIVLVAIPDLTAQVKLLAWMILIHTVFNALQDVAVDALAVELLDDDERGRANGLMYASKYAGGIIGGGGMATVIAWAGLETALVAQTAILLGIMLVPFLVRERSTPLPAREPIGAVGRALVQAFSLRSALIAALLMLGINFGIGLLSASSIKLFVVELKWDYDAYARISGGWGLAAGFAGSVAAGFLVDRSGRRRLAALASCALAAGWVGFALARPLWTEGWFVYSAAIYEATCQSVMTVSLLALCMDLSWPRIAGSQFAGYMALSNFSTTLGYQAAARAVATWEYEAIWIGAAAIQLAVTALLVPIDPTETRRKLPLAEGERHDRRGLVALCGLLVVLIGMTIYVAYLRLR